MSTQQNNFYKQEPLFLKIVYLIGVAIFLIHLYELVVNPIGFISREISELIPILAYSLLTVMSFRQYLYIKKIKKD